MTANIQTYVMDNGLQALDTLADKIYITSSIATTFTEATSTFALGNNSFGVGGAFGAPSTVSTSRQVASAAITAGSVTGTGAAAFWAVTDTANSRLYAVGTLSASQAVTSGNTFALPTFNISMPMQ